MSIEIRDLTFSYGKAEILSGVSFSVESGQVLCLLGPNGTGKSTLIKCIAKLLPAVSGKILLDGTEIKHISRKRLARKIAYIPQSSVPVFPFLVRDMVAMGRTPHKGFFDSPEKADYEIVAKALDDLNIGHLEYKSCTELSGGERQLVLFATAIVQDPHILLLDEPTSHLDFGNQMRMLQIIKDLSKKGISVIMATHTPEQAFLAGDIAAILKNGRITAWGSPMDIITEQNISEAFNVRVRVLDIDADKNIKTCVPILSES